MAKTKVFSDGKDVLINYIDDTDWKWILYQDGKRYHISKNHVFLDNEQVPVYFSLQANLFEYKTKCKNKNELKKYYKNFEINKENIYLLYDSKIVNSLLNCNFNYIVSWEHYDLYSLDKDKFLRDINELLI